ncbi:MAG: energy-coupling factor ABC transporter permease [Thermoanaerobacteraceae bacterium]|nr:energy-coupling factor ABC transporter permease [Thermoanaerobacteraceae bacterium]
MHIPDGFVDAKTAITTYTISTAFVTYSMSRAKKTMQDKNIPFMASMASFVFVAQMINFPIIGGTSGHLLGSVLLSYVFGPWVSAVIMTVVISMQAILFGDGGLTALGANVLNMAIAANFIGYFVIILFKNFRVNNTLSLVIASWVSVMISALMAAIEISLSGVVDFKIIATSMLFWHAFIGIGEGLLTAFIASAILKARPNCREVT